MEKIINALEEIKKINSAYELSNDLIEKTKKEMECAKVSTPIIGKFSSGKSALLNTFLGYGRKLLKEDITPETAIPTEILYNDMEDIVTIYKQDGSMENIELFEYRNMEFETNIVKKIRLSLNKDDSLGKIPDVMLVDMPGFESGLEIHNKAIDDYLLQSLAYIITFPADDMIVRSSVGNIMKELCIHDMPLCVTITKYDKRNDDFEILLEKLKKDLKRFIGDKKITYCCTSSFIGETEDLRMFLYEIQENSQDIFIKKYRKVVHSILDVTENYLKTLLKNNELSESELDEQEEKLNKRLNFLNEKFDKEKNDFNLHISDCVEEIKCDVQNALQTQETTFVAIAMNNQNLKDEINLVVRRALAESIKKRFIPKVEKYIKGVSNCMNMESMGDIPINLMIDTTDIEKNIAGPIVAVVAGVVMGLPLIGMLVGGVAMLINKFHSDMKREELRNNIKIKLQSEVYPEILKVVENEVKTAIVKQVKLINTSIEDELKLQRETLEKALTDIRGKINNEKDRHENLLIDIKNDLNRIGEIRNGL